MKRGLAIAVCCTIAAVVQAQDSDPFFAGRSQLLLDPSRAGFSPGARITLLHQDQFLQFPGAWRSDVINAEWCARNTKKTVRSWLGIGFNVMRDRQGLLGSRSSSIGVMPAIHLRTGQRTFLSTGIEIRWVDHVFGDATGAWGSQYDGTRYDAGIASGEERTAATRRFVEARAGLSWTLKRDAESARRRERDLLVLGVAADHVGQLVVQDDGLPTSPIPVRMTAYILGESPHEIWDDGFFAGEVIGHMQGPFHTGRVNIYAGKHTLNKVRATGGPLLLGFKAGVGYRFRDALLVNAAVDVGRTTFGVAYGWSVVNVDTYASGRRTFELLLQLRPFDG